MTGTFLKYWSIAVLLVLTAAVCHGQTHPRLFLDAQGFGSLSEKIESDSAGYLKTLHKGIMEYADRAVEYKETLEYTLDASNKRLTGTTRRVMNLLPLCAYAYRMTSDRKYLEKAEGFLKGMCALPDWNMPRHSLDATEFAYAVSLTYDWLWNELSEDLRRQVERAIMDYVLIPADNDVWSLDFYSKAHNWNQVCNGGIVCACLALDCNKELTERLIDKSVKSNAKALKKMYSPEGNYPEGPGYWSYGTSYQVVMMDALQTCLGHDFGLSDHKCLRNTAKYKLWSNAPCGRSFNYADNSPYAVSEMAMWYFAARYNDPSLLYNELWRIDAGCFFEKMARTRFLPLIMCFASKVDLSNVQKPSESMYVGYGKAPVAMIHTDWSFSETESYLGIKAGRASVNHGHMDAGSFVFDADGVRWAYDMPVQSYAELESTLRKMGNSLFNMKQESLRWDVFRYGNLRHNTLTINGQKHKVDAGATITSEIRAEDRMGVSMDLSPVFEGEAAKVSRTVELVDNTDVAVTDVVCAAEDKEAKIQWTMVSTARPKVCRRGIILKKDGKRRLLSTQGEGVRYSIFESDPKKLDDMPQLREKEYRHEGTYILGFTATVPPGQERTYVTTISK